MKPLVAAIRFLTVLPIPGNYATGEKELARSVPFFPVVGLLIGGAAAALAYGIGFVLPPPVAAAVVVIFLLKVSRGLHLDGLSDTMDAFMSSRDRERMLAIMKDSHVGAMGVIAIASALLLKTLSLASLEGAAFWRGALLAAAAGRTALVLGMALLPYVRPQAGLGTVFYRGRPRLAAVFALVFVLAAGWLAAGMAGVLAVAFGMAGVALFAGYCRAKIGGATGDTLGASCELAETWTLLFMSGWFFATR